MIKFACRPGKAPMEETNKKVSPSIQDFVNILE
jgi:hypothetical protein